MLSTNGSTHTGTSGSPMLTGCGAASLRRMSRRSQPHTSMMFLRSLFSLLSLSLGSSDRKISRTIRWNPDVLHLMAHASS